MELPWALNQTANFINTVNVHLAPAPYTDILSTVEEFRFLDSSILNVDGRVLHLCCPGSPGPKKDAIQDRDISVFRSVATAWQKKRPPSCIEYILPYSIEYPRTSIIQKIIVLSS